jgi:hypothetical protein
LSEGLNPFGFIPCGLPRFSSFPRIRGRLVKPGMTDRTIYPAACGGVVDYLPGYVAALECGWAQDNDRAQEMASFLWKRRRGYATQALRDILPDAKAEGLQFVEITTDPDNTASQRVIEANGGVLIDEFIKPEQFGGKPGLRYRIGLE